jgi:hypothetical protein
MVLPFAFKTQKNVTDTTAVAALYTGFQHQTPERVFGLQKHPQPIFLFLEKKNAICNETL